MLQPSPVRTGPGYALHADGAILRIQSSAKPRQRRPCTWAKRHDVTYVCQARRCRLENQEGLRRHHSPATQRRAARLVNPRALTVRPTILESHLVGGVLLGDCRDYASGVLPQTPDTATIYMASPNSGLTVMRRIKRQGG